MAVRRASHAGGWYSDSAKDLRKQLDSWLNNADLLHGPARAIIAPHAGYQYCGATSAFAYRQISPAVVRRVFILGPSHHLRLNGCGLTTAIKYRTPLYDLRVDTEVCSDLAGTGQFEWLNMTVDEDEHSIEMHLPYVARIMEDYKDSFTIVPILVGSLSSEKEAVYGSILSRFLADPQNLFVISSDFCHWGQRFRYVFYDRNWGEIYQSIQTLDRLGMDAIESLDPVAFGEYLKKYGNTICGRHPIGVLLQNMAGKMHKSGAAYKKHYREQKKHNKSKIQIHTISFVKKTNRAPTAVHHLQVSGTNGHKMTFRFLKYSQSSQCTNMSDSSVSYAAGTLTFE